jgi:hypothetical protein
LKDPKDRIHAILDREEACASLLDPESVAGRLLQSYTGVLKRLEAYRPESPEGFCRRVMSSLPDSPGRPGTCR